MNHLALYQTEASNDVRSSTKCHLWQSSLMKLARYLADADAKLSVQWEPFAKTFSAPRLLQWKHFLVLFKSFFLSIQHCLLCANCIEQLSFTICRLSIDMRIATVFLLIYLFALPSLWLKETCAIVYNYDYFQKLDSAKADKVSNFIIHLES